MAKVSIKQRRAKMVEHVLAHGPLRCMFCDEAAAWAVRALPANCTPGHSHQYRCTGCAKNLGRGNALKHILGDQWLSTDDMYWLEKMRAEARRCRI